MKFAVLRGLVNLSDATLSKQLGALHAAGYLSRHREYGRNRNKDTVRVPLTAHGIHAVEDHLQALQHIAGGLQPAD